MNSPQTDLQTILQSVQDTIYRIDKRGVVTWVTPSVEQLLGYPPAEVIGRPMTEFYASPEDHADFLSALTQADGVVTDYEARLQRKDGTVLWVSTSAHFHRDREGNPAGVEGLTRDINVRKIAELALRESEQRFRALANTSSSGIFVYRDRFLYVNRALTDLTGYSTDELLAMPVHAAVHPRFRELARERARARLNGDDVPQRYELIILTKQGEERWLDMSATMIQYDGAPAGFVSAVDVTHRKRMEEALVKEIQRNQLILRSSPDGFLATNTHGAVLDANPAYCRLIGYSVAELLDKNLSELEIADDPRTVVARLAAITDSGDARFETRHRHRDGRAVNVEITARYIEIGNDQFVYLFFRDIGARKRAEAKLRASETRLVDAQRIAHVGNWDWDIKNKSLYWSDEIYRLFGTDPTQFDPTYEFFLKCVHPDDRNRVQAAVTGALCERRPYSVDHRVIRRDGTELMVHEQGEVQFDNSGDAIRMHGTVHDVTDWKRSETLLGALAASTAVSPGDNFFRDCVENLGRAYGVAYAMVGVFTGPDNDRIRGLATWTNNGFVDGVEYDIAGTPCADVLCHRSNFVADGVTHRYSGTEALIARGIVSYFGVPLVSSKGQLMGVVVVMDTRPLEFKPWYKPVMEVFARRIALELERREAQEELQQSEERFRKTFNSGVAMITITRLDDGRFLDVNDSFLQASGYRREEIIGRTSSDISLWHDPADRAWILEELQRRGSIKEKELRFRHKDGSIRHIFCSAELVNLHNDRCVLFIGQDIVARKRAEDALRESETKYRLLVDHATDAIFIAQDGVLKFPNPKAVELFGYSAEELERFPFKELIVPEDRELVLDRHRRRMGGENVPAVYPFRVNNKEGRRFWVEINAIGITWDNQPATLALVRDISAQKANEEALFQEKERAQITLQSIGDGVITTGANGRIEYLNPVAEQLTGWNNDRARGRTLTEVFRIIDETNQIPMENPLDESLREWCRVANNCHITLLRADGEEFAIEYSASPIRDRQRRMIGAVVVFRNVTELRAMAHQLSHQATHDSLTGLINRREFEVRLEHALESARNADKQHALCYLDLDQFKVVNDTCGHIAGDELLRLLSAQLQSCVREIDTLARLGGDEFGILLEGCPLGKAQDIAESLRNTAKEFRFAWGDKTFEVGASIGLVPITAQAKDASEILSTADAACYVAKDLGRNRVHVYQPDDKELAQRHGEMQWVSRITRAFEENRFTLYFQRIDPLFTERETGIRGEILIRMRDREGGMIPPMAFIPAAERYNLMPTLDRWVIATAFQALKKNEPPLDESLRMVNINLSGQSLSDDFFLDFVAEQFASHKVDPRRICFEITETAAIANPTKATEFIKKLKERGCQFALDDFGSGLSSFAYLKNLQVDYLKIDGHFVQDIVQDPIDHAMVEAINRIGHVMGIKTIAEFVENEATLLRLKTLGIDYAQGLWVEAPRPVFVNSAEHVATTQLMNDEPLSPASENLESAAQTPID